MNHGHQMLLASFLLGFAVPAFAEDRFVVDLVTRQFLVRQDGEPVRLLGVEPILGEADGSPRREAAEAFGAALIGDQPLRIERDPSSPEDARPIAAYVFLPDGRMVNDELLRAGFARATTHERYRRRFAFFGLEREAIEHHKGLWRTLEPTAAARPPPSEAAHQLYQIFYATDRKATGSAAANDFFGPDRGAVSYGTCEVSIPKDHRMGQLERPSIWRLELREDPARHVVLVKVAGQAKEEFFRDLSSQVARSAGKEALVFVHGFNVDFAEAARRTAQLAYDLGFDGAPILYSWPSRGSLSPVGYGADTNSADWSAVHLQAFLRDVAASAGATTVHLIAHSMGNRVLTQALRSLATEVHAGPMPHFSQVVLTAPDIDAQTFRDQIAPAIRGTAERITLYASSGDEALQASKQVNGFPRAGDAGAGIVVVDGIDTIDVSTIDTSFMGHSYFAENGAVISDLITLIREGKPPGERAHIVAVPLGALRYWAFQR